MIYRGLLICCLMFAFTKLSSQDIEQPSSQAAKGIDAFKHGNYKLAVTEFRSLLNRYPKDPLYHYYTGASLLMANADLSQGLELLKIASTKNVSREVFYYLGLCYYRLYQFDNAAIYFKRFKDEASITQLKEYSINQDLQRTKTVPPNLKTILIPEVVAKSIVSDSSSLCKALPASIVKVTACPSFVNGCNRMLMPNDCKIGEYVYYAATGNFKIRGKEIYRIRKMSTENWSDSENVGSTINTMQDEDFPYFDTKNQNLYFCSKGFQGYGGYDIYKSHYDSVRKSWAKPENIGFPINSPFDDILYIRDDVSGITTLVSNRENETGSFTIYQLINDVIHETRGASTPLELIDISRLAVNAKERLTLQYARTASVKKNSTPLEKKNAVTEAPLIKTGIQLKTLNRPTSKYLETITKALQLQAQCDSILKISDAFRLQASGIADDTERGKLQKQITVLEMQAKDLQSSADKYYGELRETELENRQQLKNPLYTKAKENDIKEASANKTPLDNTFRFERLESSIYSDKKPIPFDVVLPEGILYKIQIATFSKNISPDYFGGFKPITAEKTTDGSSLKYYAGWFTTYSAADSALRVVQENGFKQAFIVSYYNKAKLPLSRARQIEKED